MMRLFKWMMSAVLLTMAVSVSAENEPLVNVYICEDGGCGHAVTSQEFTYNEAEVAIGEPAPSPTASIVCLEGAGCSWTDLSESEIDITVGGDGIIEPIETIPADFLSQEGGSAPDIPSDPSMKFEDPSADSRDFWILNCRGDVCQTARTKVTKNEATIIIGEEPPPGDFFVRCDATGCSWQLWSGTILPQNGVWAVDARDSVAFNYPQSQANPIDAILVQGSGARTWTNPPQPSDIIGGATSNFDQVTPSIPYTNGYLLHLGIGSGQFGATVDYEWAIISETYVAGTVVINLPSIPSGRCVVYTPFKLTYQG